MTLRDGTRMLVSTTVARPYVPEIDDDTEPGEPDDGAEAEDKPVKRTPPRRGKAAA